MLVMHLAAYPMNLAAANNNKSVRKSTQLSNKKASPEARKLYKELMKYHADGKILSGQMWAPWGIDEIEYIFTTTGKYPAVRGHDLILENNNAREIELLIEWYRKGGIPTLMWHWGAPTKGEGYEHSKMKIDIKQCFVEGTPENKAMWEDLKRIAHWLKILHDAKVPVLWRPMHEFDGDWFWYGKGTGEDFCKLWRIVYNYYTHECGFDNLIWVLPHSTEFKASFNPGRDYYDIAGVDTYDQERQELLYREIEKEHGKENVLIPLHECGTLPNPDECVANGVMWSWWMLWHTTWATDHDKKELKRIYNHDAVLTFDELDRVKKSKK